MIPVYFLHRSGILSLSKIVLGNQWGIADNFRNSGYKLSLLIIYPPHSLPFNISIRILCQLKTLLDTLFILAPLSKKVLSFCCLSNLQIQMKTSENPCHSNNNNLLLWGILVIYFLMGVRGIISVEFGEPTVLQSTTTTRFYFHTSLSLAIGRAI